MVKPFQGTAARVVIDFDKENPFVFEGYQSVIVPPEGDPTISITDPKHESSCKSGYCDGEGGLRCADGKCVDVVQIAREKRKAAEAAARKVMIPEASPKSDAEQAPRNADSPEKR